MKRFLLSLLVLFGLAVNAGAATTLTGDIITKGPWVDVRAFANFSTAKASSSTAGKTILVTNSQAVNNLTIPSDRNIRVEKGGLITINSGKTLTIKGPFSAGMYQVFTGSGTVTFGAGSIDFVRPEWWTTNTTPGTTDMGPAIQAALDSVPSSAADYGSGGGGTVRLSTSIYGISAPLKYKDRNITLHGNGIASSVIKALPSFVGSALLIIDPINHPSFVILGNAVVRDLMFDHNDVAGIQSIIANSLNDGSVFSDIRSENFNGTVLTIGKSARPGALLSQGWDVVRWFAISSGTDLVNDVFITNEANEGTFQSCKAMGLSSGTSTSVGFHIGKTAKSQAVNLYNCSSAHIVNGTGIRYNNAWQCNDYSCTFENLTTGINFQGATFADNIENTSNNARFYPTITGNHVTIKNSTGVIVHSQENPVVLIDTSAVNAVVTGISNAAINTSVTNNSTTSTVQYAYRGGMVSGAVRWTPVVTDGTNLATVSNAVGYVERIGNQYMVRLSLTITSIGSCSGNIQITGLPKEATASVPVAAAPVFADWVNLGAGYTHPYVSVGSGSSSILLRKSGTSVASSPLNFADIRVGGNNTNIYASFAYEPLL